MRIEDKFEVNFEGRKDLGELRRKSSKNQDKIRIFCQESMRNEDKDGKVEKKDKKNIVKNIVKIFIAWIEKMKM